MDYLVVFLATVVAFGIGAIWFSPKVFYTAYAKILNRRDEDVKQSIENFKPMVSYPLVFISELMCGFIIYYLATFTQDSTMYLLVILLGLFVALSNVKSNVFSFNSFKLFFIMQGQMVISIYVMGFIIIYFT